jgi:hypothetical protein
MSKEQRPARTKRLHFPLSFKLPPSFAELENMLDIIDYKIKSCTYKWIFCFHGITSQPDEKTMKFSFSLFFKREYRNTDKIQSIKLYISDNGLDVFFPIKHYKREEVDCIVEMFIDFLSQAQKKNHGGLS